MNRKEELILDLMEYEAYRNLQVPSSNGSEDAYFKMTIQSLEEAILYFEEEKVQKNQGHKKSRRKVRKKYGKERNCSYIRSLRKKSNRKVRYQKVGQEGFKTKGSAYQNVLAWTWEM